MEALTLYDLNHLIHGCVENCFPDEYWVKAETSDVRVNNNGHCYLELVEKDEKSNTFVARAKAIIFSFSYQLISRNFEKVVGQPFSSGKKVLVKVKVIFHEIYGFSLNIVDIDPSYTLGEITNHRQEILDKLSKEGIKDMNKELEMPILPQRIAVISSATAAGYEDFCDQLHHNSFGFDFQVTLFQSIMQGDKTENSILEALDAICEQMDEFDVVVIIRGGGATSDLSGFDTYMLAAACAQFPLPIIVGIGHERDSTVLDEVAHTSVKTPTAAAEFIIKQAIIAANLLTNQMEMLKRVVEDRLDRMHSQLELLRLSIPNKVMQRIAGEKMHLMNIENNLPTKMKHLLDKQRHLLELYQQKITDASPEKILSKGYSITLKEGKIVKDMTEIADGDTIVTRLRDGSFESIVTNHK